MKQGVLCKYCNPNTEDQYKIYCKLKNCYVPNYKCDKAYCKQHEFKPVARIPIGRCDECPYVIKTRTPEAGYAYDYYCNKYHTIDGPRKICGYVEYDNEIEPIPNWCPYKEW